jgi:hypothetical protein
MSGGLATDSGMLVCLAVLILQEIDNDMKQELRLLYLRNAYDSKRFYKSMDSTK